MNTTTIHPTALVAPEAKLADGVQIDAFAIIEENVEIGEGTHIHSHAIIRSGARIGAHCEIHPGAVIAGVPQDLKFQGEDTLSYIGDYTTIREYATVNRGTASRGYTKIGDHCLIMAYSHIAHDCVLQNHIIIGNASQIAGAVEIDDYAILSGSVLVHQFGRISQHAMIQGGSRVTKDIPPYTLIGRLCTAASISWDCGVEDSPMSKFFSLTTYIVPSTNADLTIQKPLPPSNKRSHLLLSVT